MSADDIAAGPEGVLAAIGRCAAGEPCSWLEQNIVTRFLWSCFPDRHAHRKLAMCLLNQREFTASRRERDRSAAARFLHQCLLHLAGLLAALGSDPGVTKSLPGLSVHNLLPDCACAMLRCLAMNSRRHVLARMLLCSSRYSATPAGSAYAMACAPCQDQCDIALFTFCVNRFPPKKAG